MSNFDQNPPATGTLGGAIAEVDPGLRAHMLRVYNYMTAGVGLTALAAMLTLPDTIVPTLRVNCLFGCFKGLLGMLQGENAMESGSEI